MGSTISDRCEIACDGLRPGMTLPGQVFDRQGRLVASKGTALTDDVLASIRSRCGDMFLGDADWPADLDTATPDELVNELEKTAKAGAEARVHARFSWEVPISLHIIERSESDSARDTPATTLDISRGGYAFLSNGFIHQGTLVYATFVSLPDRPRLTGEVKNCLYHADGMYRVGVRFKGGETNLMG